jgi:hypothetical protein
MRELCKLPHRPLMIPQANGTRVAFTLKDISDPEKKLGVYTCPSGDFTHHVSQCCKVGFEYASKLSTHNLPLRDAWMGTEYMAQLWSHTHPRN